MELIIRVKVDDVGCVGLAQHATFDGRVVQTSGLGVNQDRVVRQFVGARIQVTSIVFGDAVVGKVDSNESVMVN